MGFFHEGHLSLMERSVSECDTTIVSLFVNPLQFNDESDLDRYPTDHERDIALAESVGVDAIVIPSTEEMFPTEPLTQVSVGTVGDHFEGAHRPGHLTGVATVVTKLFAGMQPGRAYFGRKDVQQLALVRRMTVDLSLPVEVVGCPLVREPDGLALSSRNVFLGNDRSAAVAISTALFSAGDLVERGERSPDVLVEAVHRAAGGLDFEYVALADAASMQPADVVSDGTVLVVATRVGAVRLIDNVSFWSSGERIVTDRGVRLDIPSMLY